VSNVTALLLCLLISWLLGWQYLVVSPFILGGCVIALHFLSGGRWFR